MIGDDGGKGLGLAFDAQTPGAIVLDWAQKHPGLAPVPAAAPVQEERKRTLWPLWLLLLVAAVMLAPRFLEDVFQQPDPVDDYDCAYGAVPDNRDCLS